MAIAARAALGCGTAGGSAEGGVESAEGGRADAYTSPRYEAGPYDGAPQPTPDGWLAWNDYDPVCGFFTRVPEKPLPPLTWEPCGPLAGAQENGCRQIHFDWGRPRDFGGDEYILPSTAALRHDDGSIALITSREQEGDVVNTIVDVDGPVLQAIRQGSECQLWVGQGFGDHYIYGASSPVPLGATDSIDGGAIGGKLGDRPRVLSRFSDPMLRDYVAAGAGFVELPTLELHAWSDESVIALLRRHPDDTLYTGQFSAVGETLFWTAGNLAVARQNVWTPSLGSQPLLTAGDDSTHGYSDLTSRPTALRWCGVRVLGRQAATSTRPIPGSRS
jgi:hypothetical protein